MPRTLILALLLFLPLSACAHFPAEPVPSPDGRTIALLPADHPNRLILVDAVSGTVHSIPLPPPWQAETLDWIDQQLLVFGRTPLQPPRSFLSDARLFDPATAAFSKTPLSSPFPYPPFAGQWHGKPCVFSGGTHVNTTDIRTLPDFTLAGTLDFPACGLIDGWMLRASFPENIHPTWSSASWLTPDPTAPPGQIRLRPVPFQSIDLCNPDAQVIMHLDREQLHNAFQQDLTQFAAALSPDHHTLFLAPHLTTIAGGAGWPHSWIYPRGYAVFEIPSGKILYLQHGQQRIVSPAALANDSVYALLDFPDDAHQLYPRLHRAWLTRTNAQGTEKILEIPGLMQKDDAPFRAAVSPNAAFLVIAATSPTPTLRILPLRPHLAPTDIKSVPLPQ